MRNEEIKNIYTIIRKTVKGKENSYQQEQASASASASARARETQIRTHRRIDKRQRQIGRILNRSRIEGRGERLKGEKKITI